MEENGVFIEAEKLGSNSRRIRCKVVIRASLEEVWRVLTDYERMAEVLPSLTVSKIVEKGENFTRIMQVGQQDLALGLRMTSKITMDMYERDVEVSDSGKKRDLDFKMVEGDFAEAFEGKWTIEQSSGEEQETTLTYTADVKLKLWLPIQLAEGQVVKEIKTTHTCIRDEVLRLVQNAQPSS